LKGLSIAKKYYCEVGRPAIERELPEALPFLAAGLCGDGSDCLGYDDALSADHDFGPGFCLWLEDDAYRKYGKALQQIYDRLPASFEGIPARKNDPASGKRVGVFRTSDFFISFLGTDHLPETDGDWALLKEDRLRALISGEVFEDTPGIFSAMREVLAAYYPENVRIRKIADAVHLASQTGQYNYARSMERGDLVTAVFCLQEFVRSVIRLVHLLERTYEPYYKWAWKSFTELRSSEGLTQSLAKLLEEPLDTEAWTGSRGFSLNVKDEKVLLIEAVCRRLLLLLQNQGLTSRSDSFLDAHVGEILSHIFEQ